MPNKEYKMSTLWKWQEVALGLVLAAAGVIFLVMPEMAWKSITQAIAGVLCAAGLIFVIVYFVRRRANMIGYDLVKAAVLIAVGVSVYLNRISINNNKESLFGVIILLIGILIIQRSFDLWHFGGSAWVILVITALLCIIAGILIILNPFGENSKFLDMLIAGGMLFAGIITILSAFLVGHRVSRYLTEKEEEYTQPVYTETAPPAYTTDYSYKPQEPEPAYSYQQVETGSYQTEEITEPEPEMQAPQEERPVEVEIPSESGESAGGIRNLFKRKKS